MSMEFINSPFVVPVAGISIGAIAIVGSFISDIKKRELQSQERMAMLNRGMSPAEIESILSLQRQPEKISDPLRSLSNARRTAVVLISIGIGIILFGAILAALVQHRQVLVISAGGLVALCIGTGFLVDYNMQKRELARFGMEVDADQRTSPGRL